MIEKIVVATPTLGPTPTPIVIEKIVVATPTPGPTPTPVVVERIVVVTPTPTLAPVATPTPTPTVVVRKEAPTPKNPKGSLTILVDQLLDENGLGSASAPDSLQMWGLAETLFQADPSRWDLPMLVESYELNPDMKGAKLKVRQGVQFHKGYGELTAEDIAWNMNDHNAFTNPTSIGQQSGDFAYTFDRWGVIDKYTVDAKFQAFDPRWNTRFLSQGSESLPVFSKKACDTNGLDWCKAHIIATGPLQTKSWSRDSKAVFEKVPYKHWRVTPKYDQVTFVAVTEETAKLAMIRTGETDATGLKLSLVPPLQEEGFKYEIFGGSLQGLIFSGNYWEKKHVFTGAPLDESILKSYSGSGWLKAPWVANPADPKEMEEATHVRRAIALAIDREAIVKQILGGIGYPIAHLYCDPQTPVCKKYQIKYDLEAAKAELKQTRWPNGFEMPIYPMSDPTRMAVGDAVGVMLRKLGPDMNVTVPKMNYTIFRPGLVTRTTVMPWISEADEGQIGFPQDWPKAASMTSATRGGYGSAIEIPFIAERLVKTRSEPDPAKRIAINMEVEDYLDQTMLSTGIYALPNVMVYNPKSISAWPHPPKLIIGFWGVEFIEPAPGR
ncbi:MAG: ABC transporter substrate-binding protein [Chloroflexota bacterium]|nr:ABC transporter substrate-binding protein [Chloroflexota bacterium]